MKILKLKDMKSAEKFGTCIECGVGTNEDDSLQRIKFNGTSVCLCKNHMIELQDRLADCINWDED